MGYFLHSITEKKYYCWLVRGCKGRGRTQPDMKEINGHACSNGDASLTKPTPPCCLKAIAGVSETEGKCHATVVSGWFSKAQSSSTSNGHSYCLKILCFFWLVLPCKFGCL